MLSKYVMIVVAFVAFFSIDVDGQGEIDDQDKMFYRNERTYGLSLTSSGYSLNFRYGKHVTAFKKTLYMIDFSEIKHPKEIKKLYQIYANSNRYAFGKQNAFFSLKAGIGKHKEVFSKKDKGGIAIRRFYTFGAALGILKPVYYQIYYRTLNSIEEEKFDASIHRIDNIIGTASFFKGISEITFSPGVFVKYGYNFEFSKKDESVNALETGIIGEAYLFKAPMVADNDSRRFFINLFLTYRFGKIMGR